MQVPDIIHDRFGRPVDSGCLKLQLKKPQVGHGHHAGEEMTTDFAIGPAPDGLHTEQIIVFG
jgi:hypothetical protein